MEKIKSVDKLTYNHHGLLYFNQEPLEGLNILDLLFLTLRDKHTIPKTKKLKYYQLLSDWKLGGCVKNSDYKKHFSESESTEAANQLPWYHIEVYPLQT